MKVGRTRQLKVRKSCRDHINAINLMPSRYCRADGKREYFEAGLSIGELFMMYVQWVKDKGIPPEDIATKSMKGGKLKKRVKPMIPFNRVTYVHRSII